MVAVTVKDFPDLDLGDIRRSDRLVTLVNNIISKPGSSIPRQAKTWYETKAAYNFFNNEDVTKERLGQIIMAHGCSQLQDLDRVLIVHDMTSMSYNNLQADGMGYLDNKKGRGIMCYNSLAVSVDGLPLSLVYQQTWTRSASELGKAANRKTRNFEDKESYKWYEGITEVNKAISKMGKIHIADRAADVYELFFSAYESDTDLLIRACHNRRLSDASHLWDHIAQQASQGAVTLEILDEKGRKRRPIEAEVRFKKVEILRPVRSKDKYESVELTAIEVRQIGETSDDQEGLYWTLLTSLEVSSLTDVLKYIRWYTYRWLIERFHYVLKGGTKLEELQLKEAESLEKAIPVYSLAAFKIMQLVYHSRYYPDVSCEIILTKPQWIALYVLIHQNKQIPNQPPSLSQAVKWIARLGGHLGRKSDGPPGLKTVWRGYQTLSDAATVYEILYD